MFHGGCEEVGGFEDFEIAFGVPTPAGAVDDGFGIRVIGDLLEGNAEGDSIEKAKVGKTLLKEKNRLLGISDRAQRDESQRQQRLLALDSLTTIEATLEATPEAQAATPESPIKEHKRLQGASKRYQKYQQEWHLKSSNCTQNYKSTKQKKPT